MTDLKAVRQTDRASSRGDSLNMSLSIRHKKKGIPMRIGKALEMNQDFYAMTFISLFSVAHMFLIAFQSKIENEKDEKKEECDRAESNLETAKDELSKLQD